MKLALTISAMALLSLSSATTLKSQIASNCEASVLAETEVPRAPAGWENKINAIEIGSLSDLEDYLSLGRHTFVFNYLSDSFECFSATDTWNALIK